MIQNVQDEVIMKHKGAGKHLVTQEWFENQLDNIETKQVVTYMQHFHRDWRKLLIQHKESTPGSVWQEKAYPVPSTGEFIDTRPIHLGEQSMREVNQTAHRIIKQLIAERLEAQDEPKASSEPSPAADEPKTSSEPDPEDEWVRKWVSGRVRDFRKSLSLENKIEPP
jgi:hypothetical protein